MDAESLFFKPREVHVQGRLDFLDVPPQRVVVVPVEADEFTGIQLHYLHGKSQLCLGGSACPFHAMGDLPRDYFYAPAYVYSHVHRRWNRALLPVGNTVAPFAERKLKGKAWRVSERVNKQGQKRGLIVAQEKITAEVEEEIATFQPFDIKSRLLVRYNVQ